MCLRCGALERHRTLWLFIERETEVLNGPAHVLHFAPERGISSQLARRSNLDYVIADIEPGEGMEGMDITAIFPAPTTCSMW